LAHIDDFTVIGGCKPDPSASEGRRKWERTTREVLEKAGDFKPQGKLSGSFI
jgi:hypothetical protein